MYLENSKKIFWVFNKINFEVIPSYYVSGILPSNYLNSSKLIFLEEHDPKKTLNNIDAEVLILLKVFDKGFLKLAKEAKKRGIKIISVFDDWHSKDLLRTNLNLPLAILSDLVVVKTNSAANEIESNFTIRCKVIPDPIRFKKKKINFKNSNNLNICWFGTHNNHDTIINEINNLKKISIPLNITIISNYISELKKNINSLNITTLKINILEWHKNADLDIIKSEIVILPYPKDKKRLVKSSNRIIDSLNLGRFTVLSPVSQFKEFKDFVYFGDITEGILWFKENEKAAKEKTILGQKYVDQNYSLEFVSEKWKNIIS